MGIEKSIGDQPLRDYDRVNNLLLNCLRRSKENRDLADSIQNYASEYRRKILSESETKRRELVELYLSSLKSMCAVFELCYT